MSNIEKTNKALNISFDLNKTIVELNKEHFSFEEQIKKELEANRFNSIITFQNYKDMKNSATELNKTITFISNFRKDKKKSEMVHIDEFENNLKSYCTLIQEKREKILQGLDVFDEETRKQVQKACKDYLEFQVGLTKLRDEFANIDIQDMTQLGFITPKGDVSKKAKDEIEKRVNEKLNLQNKVDNRILNLENLCLKEGIEPLGYEHIQGFIYDEDEVYKQKLQNLINTEKERIIKIKEKQKVELEEEIKASDIATNTPDKLNETLKEEVKEVDNPFYIKDKVQKTLCVRLKVPSHATNEQIINTFIKMIKDDKFPLDSIEVS